MATKSFTTDFKFNINASEKLINAIEKSKKVNHNINQRFEDVSKKEEIDLIMESFMREDNWIVMKSSLIR